MNKQEQDPKAPFILVQFWHAQKLADDHAKVAKLLDDNKDCESLLASMIGETDRDGVMYSNCTKDHFSKCNTKFLKAFVHAREFDVLTIPRDAKWHWPTRKIGLIDLAFERRSLMVKLTIPTVVEAEEAVAVTMPEPTVVE